MTDYTWGLRFPEPPCAPAAARRALLSEKDGLFEGEDGKASLGLEALLGPGALFKASSVILGVQV